MVQIAGKYVQEKQENFVAFLLAVGIPEEYAKRAETAKTETTIAINGKNIEISTKSPNFSRTATYIDGEEVDDSTERHKNTKSVAVLKGDVLEITSKYADGKTGLRKYTFTDAGYTLELSETDAPNAVIYNKRV
ncbi:fatty acid-binding protein 1, liver [Aethina tumida]|uniref:fatty acid-binding protein 1, liver n=1 Tax=Aethina tumida TaxID=116153 RepID=UPI00096B1080|nr:fatty acid-binding protein 1, liver [Aethina tumida]